jgi:hypothetical protein
MRPIVTILVASCFLASCTGRKASSEPQDVFRLVSQIALQTMLFPTGVSYDRETSEFEEVRTPGFISLFSTLETIRVGKMEGLSCWRPKSSRVGTKSCRA